MNVHEAVKIYVKEHYPNSQTATQQEKRLYTIVKIFSDNGITIPTEADYENILKPAIASKGKKQGQPASERTINDRISLARKFYTWYQSKGDLSMIDNEVINNEQEQTGQPDFSPEALNEAKSEQEDETPTKKAVGRPKTGRTEKLTLYTTAETLEELNMLIAEYGTNITELLNKLIDDYLATQSKQIAWLKDRKQQFNKLFVK